MENSMKIQFDSESKLSYGVWECPDCHEKFYGNGAPIHKQDCPLKEDNSYTQLIYHYTAKEKAQLTNGVEPSFAPPGILEAYKASL